MAKIGDHALVLGGSLSGLLTASVLCKFYDAITIVERDALTDTVTMRRGVPQGRHIHALLMRGAQAMEELFPGILDEFVRAGVPHFDGGDLCRLYFCVNGHLGVRTGLAEGLITYAPSRPFLECHVRRRMRDVPNVTFLDQYEAVDLCSSRHNDRVTGARIVNRRDQTESLVAADLVVDATGRGARTPALLEKLGYARPLENRVVVHITYASQLLRMPPDTLEELAFIIGPAPGRATGMGLAKNENDTWMFTVFGMAGISPPGDLSGMCTFVEDFAPAHAVSAVRAGEPIGEPSQHGFPSSRWRRYDKARQWPEGLLVVGDAVCSFNPIYAQGMTVAALEALALRDCLFSGATELPLRFFRATTKPISQAWQMAAGSDLSVREIEGTPPLSTKLINGYIDRVLTAAEHDIVAFTQFLKVAWLVDPPARLLTPAMMWRAASANRRRQISASG
jgi:2-polyprenyl-6-methoxyphenol hydroxylase-like FAD-dependent oxidoreductase